MKHLHLIQNATFTQPYINFINKNFNPNEHLFLILGGISEDKMKISEKENVYKISESIKDNIVLLKQMYMAERIYLHGLNNPKLVLKLFLQPWLLSKCNWLIWGADLYYYKFREKGLKSNIYEFIRKYVIKHIGGLITQIKGDYELAKQWYSAKGKYYYCFMYLSNTFKENELIIEDENFEKTYIQVGNSAFPVNNHLEVFDKLKKYRKENIEIICPLSYGSTEYRDKVIDEGTKIFGKKFNPIIEFMAFGQYLKVISRIDIAIFNHNRQQAMGNITTLLGFGKKVYIRDDITTWRFCEEHELKVYNSNQDLSGLLDDVPEEEKLSNINNVKNQFSEKKLESDWKVIFSEGNL